LGQQAGVPMVAGALTPSEIAAAWQAGAAGVKVFPVMAVGGASYIRSLQGPLAGIPLIPTGGVTPKAAVDLVEAGAIAVGLASALFPKAQVQAQDWASISAQIEALVQALPSYPA
jgi:2-dehydro-3-deoxyphosphogluconate aldolase / (4S)-4-hydroxy-2-oxoglutarate aldolase